ncbi:MAG: hypothetical protein P8X94_13325 [Woeseiaceae bacterium]
MQYVTPEYRAAQYEQRLDNGPQRQSRELVAKDDRDGLVQDVPRVHGFGCIRQPAQRPVQGMVAPAEYRHQPQPAVQVDDELVVRQVECHEHRNSTRQCHMPQARELRPEPVIPADQKAKEKE